ncbi:hypothetical protein GCM10025777_03900 [Membranihabitans marinus]
MAQTGINTIAEEALHRGLEALAEFKALITEFGVDEVKAIGTAALRSGVNAQTFIGEVKNRFQFDIEIIDGDREASLIQKGIAMACPQASEHALMMDIGGGSIEFILTREGNTVYQESIAIGLGILNNEIPLSDPANFQEIQQIKSRLNKSCHRLIVQLKKHQPKKMVGAAGSFELIAEALGSNIDSDDKCSIAQLEDMYRFIRPLIFSTYEERMKNEFIPQKRVNLAVYAFVVIEWILDIGNFDEIYISKYSLKEGALKEYRDHWLASLRTP